MERKTIVVASKEHKVSKNKGTPYWEVVDKEGVKYTAWLGQSGANDASNMVIGASYDVDIEVKESDSTGRDGRPYHNVYRNILSFRAIPVTGGSPVKVVVPPGTVEEPMTRQAPPRPLDAEHERTRSIARQTAMKCAAEVWQGRSLDILASWDDFTVTYVKIYELMTGEKLIN